MTSPLDERVRNVLEAWYEAVDDGRRPDLESLCDGDDEVLGRARELLRSDPLEDDTAGGGATPPAAAEGLPLERLGEFRLISPIGAGGMGEVYLAEQEGLKRLVALKLLRSERLADPRARLRMEREALVTGRLEHPNIVPVYAVGDQDGLPYIAMRYLSGPSLDALPKPVPPRDVARLGATVARALDVAHESGILHRDVKPANVILDDETPFVVDFGLALSSQFDTRLSHTGQTYGTLPFMAPEQFSGDTLLLDARTDVYGLGATLYELIAGQPPFGAGEPDKIVRDILLRDPPPLPLTGRDKDLDAIVRRALDKDPARRFQRAAAMAEDLERYLRGEATRTRPPTPVSRAWRRARRYPRTSLTLSASVLVVAVFVLLFLQQRSEREASFRAKELALHERLHDGRLVDAEKALADLRTSFPGDDRVADLAREYEAHDATSDLLDYLIVRLSQSPTELERRVDRVHRSGAERLIPRQAGIALALADLHAKDLASARTRIDEVERAGGKTRATTVIRSYLDAPTELDLTFEAGTELDHVASFVCLALTDAPSTRQLEEARLAEAKGKRGFRGKLAHACVLTDEKKNATARAILDYLIETGEAQEIVRRLARRVDLRLGHAAAVIEAIEAIPDGERVPWDVKDLISALGHERRFEEMWRVLEKGRERWPRDEDLLYLEAQNLYSRAVAARSGKDAGTAPEEATEDAVRLFRRLAESALRPARREKARSRELMLKWILLDPTRPRRTSLDREDLLDDYADLDEDARDLAATARDDVARSRALYVMAMCTAGRPSSKPAASRFEAAAALIQKAIDAGPDIGPRTTLGEFVHNFLLSWTRAGRELTPSQREILTDARNATDDVLDPTGWHGHPPSTDQLRLAELMRFLLAKLDGDLRWAKRAWPKARAAAEHLNSPFRELVEAFGRKHGLAAEGTSR